MEDNINNELEDLIANDMAYTFSRNMLMSSEETRNMVETAQRYGLTEKQAALMLMEFSSIQESEDN